MFKKTILTASIASVLLVTGCNTAESGQQAIQGGDHLSWTAQTYPLYYGGPHGNNQRAMNTARTNTHDYGFTRYQRQEVDEQQNPSPIFDYQVMSDAISRVVLTNDEISEVATLVTDQYVLVAYDAQADNEEYVADQVKRSAISIVPRYYDVVISNDPGHFEEISRFRNQSTNSANLRQSIEQTINEMKQSPQGEYDEDTDQNVNLLEKKKERLMDR